MPSPKPIHTNSNTRAKHRILWGITLFWRSGRPNTQWRPILSDALLRDHIRLLRHRRLADTHDQFLVSASPEHSPCAVVRLVKGRLGHIVREEIPKPFRRNYAMHSVGPNRRETVENYVAAQIEHHRMADEALQRRFRDCAVRNSGVDLSQPRASGHAHFVHNLHLVFVNDVRFVDVREDILVGTRDMVLRAAEVKGHCLSALGIAPDHIHIALGCGINDAPRDVALSYMNNICFVHGMRQVFQDVFFAATFGDYDLGAVNGSEI